MTAAKLAYQTRFSVPSQLDSPLASFGHFNPYQSAHDQRLVLQEESTKLNAPVAKVLSNFDVKADQLRQFYDSTTQQVRLICPFINPAYSMLFRFDRSKITSPSYSPLERSNVPFYMQLKTASRSA